MQVPALKLGMYFENLNCTPFGFNVRGGNFTPCGIKVVHHVLDSLQFQRSFAVCFADYSEIKEDINALCHRANYNVFIILDCISPLVCLTCFLNLSVLCIKL